MYSYLVLDESLGLGSGLGGGGGLGCTLVFQEGVGSAFLFPPRGIERDAE